MPEPVSATATVVVVSVAAAVSVTAPPGRGVGDGVLDQVADRPLEQGAVQAAGTGPATATTSLTPFSPAAAS